MKTSGETIEVEIVPPVLAWAQAGTTDPNCKHLTQWKVAIRLQAAGTGQIREVLSSL